MTPSEKNAFQELDGDVKAPENLEKQLSSELDTIRNAGQILELYVGTFIQIFSRLFPSDQKINKP